MGLRDIDDVHLYDFDVDEINNNNNNNGNSTELSSFHSNGDEFLFSSEDDVDSATVLDDESVQYPYKVIYQLHEVTIESQDIKQSNKLKCQYVVLSLCFLLFGLSDSTVGTVMPSLIEEYGIDHSQASYLFSSQFLGYLVSSLLSNYLINNYGFYGGLLMCEFASCLCYLIIFCKRPFWVIVMSYSLCGFGGGVLDSTSNVWVGRLKYSNQLLGLIHAEYGLGGMISPVVLTRMVKNGISWRYYYLFLSLLCFSITVAIGIFFQKETKWKHKYMILLKAKSEGNSDEDLDVTMKEVLSNNLVWFFSIVLFIYTGGELAIGSWIYNYLIVIKSKPLTVSSYITSFYWFFMTLGRVVLGFVIGHWFETRELTAVVICCSIISFFSFIFTLFVHWLSVQSIAIFVVGFFVGPMFPTIVVVAMRYLPLRLETAGVGTLVAMGGGGAAIIPYLIGLVSKVRPNGGGLVWFPLIIFIVFSTDAICFFIFYMKHR